MSVREQLEQVLKGLELGIGLRDPQYGAVYLNDTDEDMLQMILEQIESSKELPLDEGTGLLKALHRVLDNYLTLAKNYEGNPSAPAFLSGSEYTEPLKDKGWGPMGQGPETSQGSHEEALPHGSQISANGYAKAGPVSGAAFRPDNASSVPELPSRSGQYTMAKSAEQWVDGEYLDDRSWGENTDLAAAAVLDRCADGSPRVNVPPGAVNTAEILRSSAPEEARASTVRPDAVPAHPAKAQRQKLQSNRAAREAARDAFMGRPIQGVVSAKLTA